MLNNTIKYVVPIILIDKKPNSYRSQVTDRRINSLFEIEKYDELKGSELVQ